MIYELDKLNKEMKDDPAGFARKCDADLDRRLRKCAEEVAGHLSVTPTVLLSGPSASGKTTAAGMLEKILDNMGIETHVISMDDYFLTVDRETAPKTPDGRIDYESPKCLDIELLLRHFEIIDRGGTIDIPTYDFTRKRRVEGGERPLKVNPGDAVIFEGIHALNGDIMREYGKAARIFVAPSGIDNADGTPLFKGEWVRFLRRMVRDWKFRGTPLEETLEMWDTVMRGEKLYIRPFEQYADFAIDTFLPYEIGIFKANMPPVDVREYKGAWRGQLEEIKKVLPVFESMDADLVPECSLLTEFFGGICKNSVTT
jgi:uridine kinase